MTHRSNQAVASQERNPAEHTPPPRQHRRLLIGWGTALAALAVSTAALGLVVWLARFPIAQFILSSALAERGVEADFQVASLDLEHATLNEVRVGSAGAPDVSVRQIDLRWDWNGLAPSLRALRFVEPHLRLRLDDNGRVSAGALDHVGGAPSGQRPHIPRLSLTIERGALQLDAPFGPLIADVQANGTFGDDFTASARLRQTTSARRDYALQEGNALLTVASRQGGMAFRVSIDAQGLLWNNQRASDVAFRALGYLPLDLARYDIEGAWRFGMLHTATISASDLTGTFDAGANTRDDSLLAAAWQGRTRTIAQHLDFAGAALTHARFDAELAGRELRGQGRWSMGGEGFEGFSLASARAGASGVLNIDLSGAGRADSDGQISLQEARLDAQARHALRSALPEMGGTPIGPTLEQARGALDRAASKFDLSAPLSLHIDASSTRIVFSRPIAAHASSGARLTLAPLRVDAPALTWEWPGAVLHGAVDAELAGGGAPTASLLLDTVNWSPGAPLEGDGTLALSHWATAGASIAADELNIAISVGEGSAGRIDLRGPARITGPLGGGEVRDMIAGLNVGVLWGAGWRVVANNACIPIQLGGLDAAGLSFNSGHFDLCALNGALASADARGNLGGGFRIQSLALNGQMAGPQAQPARFTATSVGGQFHGAAQQAQLSVAASAPSLAITIGPRRTLTLTGAQLTANALLARDWRIEGRFTEGALSDPALPGAVTAIAGHWGAEPESGKAVVRVDAGQALLSANRPATEADRPLFHPLRLNNFSAILADGELNAEGMLVLAEQSRQLAHFTAHHDIDAGIGGAVVTSDALRFDRGLQPYQVSEFARGFVDNVRGNAAFTANIDWNREAITAHGSVHLDGVSLATSTIPLIQGVRGDMAFDDLFNLTTPPGQEITIETLNPGLTVHNGRVRFQLLPGREVSIERAEFDFASGVLAMAPTIIPLGADATHFELSLRDVDAAALLATLNIPDVTATGRIDGTFPLLLTRRTAIIQNGVLRARPGGGTLSYVGHAGDGAAGPARIAFDALKSFRYDDLNIGLNGDLSGELVSSIQFSGHNSGRPVDLGDIVPIPGLGHVTVRGVPFVFHVTLTAPFRSLAETAASIGDPTAILRRAGNPAPAPVDQTPPAPR